MTIIITQNGTGAVKVNKAALKNEDDGYIPPKVARPMTAEESARPCTDISDAEHFRLFQAEKSGKWDVRIGVHIDALSVI